MKERLRFRGLPALGKKADLIDRVTIDMVGGVEEMKSCKLTVIAFLHFAYCTLRML